MKMCMCRDEERKFPLDVTTLKNCILNHFLRDTMGTDLTLLSYP